MAEIKEKSELVLRELVAITVPEARRPELYALIDGDVAHKGDDPDAPLVDDEGNRVLYDGTGNRVSLDDEGRPIGGVTPEDRTADLSTQLARIRADFEAEADRRAEDQEARIADLERQLRASQEPQDDAENVDRPESPDGGGGGTTAPSGGSEGPDRGGES